MSTVRQRIYLTTVSALLLFGLLALSSPAAYGDELLLSDSGYLLEVVSDAEGIAGDTRPMKVKNPVNVFMSKVNGAGSAVNSAVRDIAASGVNQENNMVFALAGLFFLFLMLRFRKRSKKSRFS